MTAAARTLPAGCAPPRWRRASTAGSPPFPRPPPQRPASKAGAPGSRTGQQRPFPPLPRGLDPAGQPDTQRTASCRALADKECRTSGARESRGTPPAWRSPGYVPVQAFPLQLLSGREAQTGAGRLPAQPAPALSRILGQMRGGLSRAIGLGRCFRLISRVSPGLAAPLWAGKRGSRRAPHLARLPHSPPVPQVPLFPPLEPRL